MDTYYSEQSKVPSADLLWKGAVIGCLIIKPFMFYGLMDIRINLLFLWASTALILVLLFGCFKNAWIPYVLYGVLSLLMFLDVTFNAYFNNYLSINDAGSIRFLPEVLDMVSEVIRPEFWLLFIDLPLIAFVLAKTGFNWNRRKWPQAVLLTWVISFLLLGSVSLSSSLRSAGNLEFFSAHIKDMLQSTTGFGKQDIELLGTFHYSIDKGRQDELFGIAKGRDLIVIQVESLQDFVIDREYEAQEITPVLNSLIRERGTLYFDHYYMQIGAGNTSDAEFATNNSIYGSEKSYTYDLYKNNSFRGLPILLKEAGYSTVAMHGYEGGFWNRCEMYPSLGFDTFIDCEGYEPTATHGWGILDEEFYLQSVEYLKKQSRPFYSFMISLSNHTPFEMEKKYCRLKLSKEHRNTRFGNYLNSTAYTDYAIGVLLDALKEAGLYENSIIAIYGDHFGLTIKDGNNEELMTEFLGKPYCFDEMANVPLIIHIPREIINERVSIAGGQLDFMPTMAYLMGFENLDTVYLGQNLIKAEEGFVAQNRYAPLGSFITNEIAFLMSSDNVFENGKAWFVETGEEAPLDGLVHLADRSAALIAVSEKYLEEDSIYGALRANTAEEADRRE